MMRKAPTALLRFLRALLSHVAPRMAREWLVSVEAELLERLFEEDDDASDDGAPLPRSNALRVVGCN